MWNFLKEQNNKSHVKSKITLRGAKRREKQVIGIVNKVSLLGTREEVHSGRGEVKGQPGSSN